MRFVIREKEHVNYFSQKLKELGSSPLKVFPPAFAAAGFVTGKALDLLSLKERYKLGISFENKAAEMYLSFIEMSAKNPELAELNDRLWYFLIDEEEHQFWFKEQLSKIETSKDSFHSLISFSSASPAILLSFLGVISFFRIQFVVNILAAVYLA